MHIMGPTNAWLSKKSGSRINSKYIIQRRERELDSLCRRVKRATRKEPSASNFWDATNCIVDSRSKDSHFFQTNTSSENKKKEGYARVSCSFELWSRRLAPGGGHDGGMMCIIVCVGALIRISGWAKFSDRIYDIFGWSDVNYTFYLYIRRRIRRELHFFRTVMTSWTGYLETKVLHL